MIFQEVPLTIPQETADLLSAGFNRVVKFLEQGGRLNLQVLSDLKQQLSVVIANNKPIRSILEQADKGKDFFNINLCHPDAGLLNLPWGIALDPVSKRMLSEVPQVCISKNVLTHKDVLPEPAAGPLKILVMISSPRDVTSEGRLYFEEEERQLLQAFEPLFNAGEIQVDFTDNGSLEALREKVEKNNYHILHFSGHGDIDRETGEGFLVLEDPVSLNKTIARAREFSEAMLKDGHRIPLVVLSSCRTAQASYEKGTAGFTGKLMAKGIPAVVSMGLSITDRYATTFAARLYHGLAAKKTLVQSFSEACSFTRQMEAEENTRARRTIEPLQWLIPQLYLSGDLHLLDWQKPFERLKPQGNAILFANTTMEKSRQDKEQFVGRRLDLARILPVLCRERHVLLKGQGGIGKTTLARKLVQRLLAAKPNAVPFIYNEEGKEFSLEEVMNQLKAYCLKNKHTDWLEGLKHLKDNPVIRITHLYEQIASEQPLILVFDNLETFQVDESGEFRVEHSATLEIIRFALGCKGIYTLVTGRYPLKEAAGEVDAFDINDIELNDFIRKCYNLGMQSLTQQQMEFLYRSLGGNFRYLEFFHKAFCGDTGNLDREFLGFEAFQIEVEKYSGEVMQKMAENIVFDKLWARLKDTNEHAETGPHSPYSPHSTNNDSSKTEPHSPYLPHSTYSTKKGLAIVLAHYDLPVIDVAFHVQGINPLPLEGLMVLRDLTLIQVYLDRETQLMYYFMPPLVRGLLAERGLLGEMGEQFHDRAGEYHYYMYEQIQKGSIAQLNAAVEHFYLGKNQERISETGDILADYYYRYSFYADALRVCRAVETLFSDQLPWWCCNSIGLIGWSTGNYDGALSYFQRGLKILEEIAEPGEEELENIGVTLNNISLIYKARGDLDLALEYLEKDLTICRQMGNKSGEGVTLNNISTIFQARGDLDQALEYLEKVLTICRQMGDKSGEGVTLNNIGQIYDARGDLNRALEYLEKALEISHQIGDKSGEGVTLNNISTIYHARGDLDRALKYLEKSLVIFQQTGNKKNEGVTLNNISTIYQARGNLDRALEYLEKALEISRQLGDKSGEGTRLNNIGHILQDRGDLDRALECLEKALEISRQIGDKSGEGVTLNNISQIYDARGDWDRALEYLEKALTLSRQVGDIAVEAVTCYNMAKIFEKQGKIPQAIAMVERTVEIDKYTKHPDLESDSQYLNDLKEKISHNG